MNTHYERFFQRGDLARLRAHYPRVSAQLLAQRFLLPPAPEGKAVAVDDAAICCTVPFELKTLDATGEFEGLASVYAVLDAQGDVVDRGAFATSLHRRPQVPILWNHEPSEVLGIGELFDTPEGLKIVGRLNLAVARAREIYALLKQRAITGLSIGFNTIRSEWRQGARHLLEVSVPEVSITPFPAQPLAIVQAVKSSSGDAREEEAMMTLLNEIQHDLITRRGG